MSESARYIASLVCYQIYTHTYYKSQLYHVSVYRWYTFSVSTWCLPHVSYLLLWLSWSEGIWLMSKLIKFDPQKNDEVRWGWSCASSAMSSSITCWCHPIWKQLEGPGELAAAFESCPPGNDHLSHLWKRIPSSGPSYLQTGYVSVPKNRRALKGRCRKFTKTNFHTPLKSWEFACNLSRFPPRVFFRPNTEACQPIIFNFGGLVPYQGHVAFGRPIIVPLIRCKISKNYGLASLCFGGTLVLQLQIQPLSTEPWFSEKESNHHEHVFFNIFQTFCLPPPHTTNLTTNLLKLWSLFWVTCLVTWSRWLVCVMNGNKLNEILVTWLITQGWGRLHFFQVRLFAGKIRGWKSTQLYVNYFIPAMK